MYNLKIIKCGNRLELYKFNNYAVKEQVVKEDKTTKDNNKDKNKDKKSKEENRIDNLNITRNKIVRLIKCNRDMSTFITLTFQEESNFKDSKKLLNNLFNKLRRDYKDLKYLWVLEYGELNQRLHYHILCNIQIDIKLSSSKERKSKDHKALENNFKAKYWKYGFVDIRSLTQEDNTNIALYVSSYIVKSLGNKDLEGYRVFGYSNKTLEKPIEIKLMDNRAIEDILKTYKDYCITYSSSYSIGYTYNGKEHKGVVTYIDLELKGCSKIKGGSNEN